MKKSMFILILSLVFEMGYSQSENYSKSMKTTMKQMYNAKGASDLQDAANTFERIAQAEKNHWLPWYYAAYSTINKCFMGISSGQIDQELDKAQSYIDKARELDANNDEIEVLQGFLYQARIQVDPQNRGQQYSMKSGASFGKALELNPDNPRADFLVAQNLLYTPEAFGGGAKVACPRYKAAAEKFAKFKPASELAPGWGEEMNELMLKQNCK